MDETTTKAVVNRHREVERPSASLCEISSDESVLVTCDPTTKQWVETKADSKNAEATPIVQMDRGTTVRVSPMEWRCGGWAEEHFHEALKLPATSTEGRGIVVTVEAMARECVAIALSPVPNFELGKTYAVHIGASCNLQTVIRRRIVPTGNDGTFDEAVDVTVPTPQICTPHKFSSYWIALHSHGKLSVGLGNIPGCDCMATLDDSLYHALRSGVDAVRYVGVGNSALGRNARKVRNVRLMALPESFQAFDDIIQCTDYCVLTGADSLNLDKSDTMLRSNDADLLVDSSSGNTGKDACGRIINENVTRHEPGHKNLVQNIDNHHRMPFSNGVKHDDCVRIPNVVSLPVLIFVVNKNSSKLRNGRHALTKRVN